jgi:hypothetical protein
LNSYVVVTTKHRGVFFGRLEADEGDKVKLAEARNCLRWAGTKGFLGLAAAGPTGQCRIGPAAPELVLYGVTSVSVCSDEARKAWEAEPWS